MSWRSVTNRGMVASSLVVLILSGMVAPVASAESGTSNDRAWMVTFMQDAADHGYAVAGSSPASSRFIPTT
jgi:hypothetical protein